MNNKIILVSGKARHGKTEFARQAKEYLESQNKRVCIIAFGDLLKFWAGKYFGWDGTKTETQRTLLQTVGDNFRKYNMDFWAEKVADFIHATYYYFDYFIVDDTRYGNEISCIQWQLPMNDIYTVRIERENFESDLTPEQRAHSSECDLDNYTHFEYKIYNDGDLEKYKKAIRAVIDDIDRGDI